MINRTELLLDVTDFPLGRLKEFCDAYNIDAELNTSIKRNPETNEVEKRTMLTIARAEWTPNGIHINTELEL